MYIYIGYSLNMAKYALPRSLSGTADRACEVCFRSKTEGGKISPYSVYNLFITYFNTEFTFCKLSYCDFKYLTCSTLSGFCLYSFGKDCGEILLNKNNKQTLRESDVYKSHTTSGIYIFIVVAGPKVGEVTLCWLDK